MNLGNVKAVDTHAEALTLMPMVAPFKVYPPQRAGEGRGFRGRYP
jgi:hypothetical protein